MIDRSSLRLVEADRRLGGDAGIGHDDINLPRREVLTHAFLSDVSLGAAQPRTLLVPPRSPVRPYLFRFAARSTISPASDDSPRTMSQTERYTGTRETEQGRVEMIGERGRQEKK